MWEGLIKQNWNSSRIGLTFRFVALVPLAIWSFPRLQEGGLKSWKFALEV